MSDYTILSLWGMPGSGKTYWGKKLAQHLSLNFIDLDNFIEQKYNTSIFEMVNQNGESFFREKEKEALQEVLNIHKYLVLALGGGTPCNDSNLKMLKDSTLSIWLNTRIDTIIENLEKLAGKRPLLDAKSDLRAQLETLIEIRKEYYKRADLQLDQPLDIQSILKIIPNSFKNTNRQ